MPRRSSSSGGRSSSFRPAPRPVHSAPPPKPVQQAPPPAPVQPNGGGSMLSGIGSTIVQGMAFGTGSAVAHRAVDSIMGPRTVAHEHVTTDASTAANSAQISTVGASDACANQSKSFQDCLNAYGNEIGKCQFYIDMLNECRRGSSMSL